MPASRLSYTCLLLFLAGSAIVRAQETTPTPSATPPATTAVWDRDVARAGLLERAHAFLATVAKSRVLLASCQLPSSVTQSQRTLEEAYRSVLLDLNLASAQEIAEWQAYAGASPLSLSKQECDHFAQRMIAAQGQYTNALHEIDALRGVL
jgi:hypothetical protein